MTVRLNWGFAVAAFYSVFALSTVGFVVFAMGRRVDLVSADYYAQALAHDRHVQAVANADALGQAVAAAVDGGHVLITLPPSMATHMRGTATLYRAADAGADRTVSLIPDADGRQAIPLAGLAAGRWQLQLTWSADGRDYYVERDIRIP